MSSPIPESVLSPQRFLELQQYLGWSGSDDANVPALRTCLAPESAAFVTDFYAELVRHPAASRVMTGGQLQIERLKASLGLWLDELLSGNYDEAYVRKRWQVGYRHVLIGLDQIYVSAALSRLRMQMLAVLQRQPDSESARQLSLSATLNRLLDLDQILIHAAYDAEFHARQTPIHSARLLQQRWLTRISERALSGTSLEELLDVGLLAVIESLKPDVAAVLIPVPGLDCWRVVSETGWLQAARQLRIESQDWFAAALRSTDPLISEDLRADPRFTLPPLLIDAGLISGVVARIGDDEEPFGVLSLGFNSRIRLTDADGDFIKSLTNLLTAALQRMQQTSRWQASERRLKRLVDRLPAGAVYVVDEELFINAAVEAITGFSRAELTHLGQWKAIVRDIDPVQAIPDPGLPGSSEGAVTRHRELLKRQDGAERLIEVVAFRSATDEVWLVHDVTDAESRRQQALQAERLAVIGQMITGLAHEARNALQRMRASTETLELDLEDRPDVLPVLERLGAAQDDLKTLFDEVRNYAAPIVLAREAVDLRRLVETAWDSLFELHRRRRALLQVDISDELAMGDLDPFRIEQVLRNLFENSLAACPDPVEVGVAGSSAMLDGQPAVELIVSDNGPGLPEAVRRRVFEPFFTTKAKGTGLGMAIAERILLAHGGRIEIGAPAHGAEFRILLPRVHHVSPAEDRHR